MKIYAAKPFVAAATAGVFTDVRRFAGVYTCVYEHVGALSEGLMACGARVKCASLTDSRSGPVHRDRWGLTDGGDSEGAHNAEKI